MFSIGEEEADNESATKAKMGRRRSGTPFFRLLHVETDLHGASYKMGDEYLIKREMSNAKLAQLLIRYKINLIFTLPFM